MGAVDLFDDNKTSDLMRKDEVAKTPEKISFFADFRREAIGAANDNSDIFAVYKGAIELGGEVGGREVGAALVG